MRRIFWLSLGLGAGATASVMASRWMKRQTQRMAPANLARQAGGRAVELGSALGQAVREFREGVAEKEAEVRSSLEE
jgi:hypothetical protein